MQTFCSLLWIIQHNHLHTSYDVGNRIYFLNKHRNKRNVPVHTTLKMKIFIFLLFHLRDTSASCTETKIRLSFWNFLQHFGTAANNIDHDLWFMLNRLWIIGKLNKNVHTIQLQRQKIDRLWWFKFFNKVYSKMLRRCLNRTMQSI